VGISTSRAALLVAGVGAAPVAWLISRLLSGEPFQWPLFISVGAVGVGMLVGFGPRIFYNDKQLSSLSLEEQLELARFGVIARAEVTRVDYARKIQRGVGYRDTSVADTSRGTVTAAFAAEDGARDVIFAFDKTDPSLSDGDAVDVLYDPRGLNPTMPIRFLADVELPLKTDS
jgi:hypothetical protein